MPAWRPRKKLPAAKGTALKATNSVSDLAAIGPDVVKKQNGIRGACDVVGAFLFRLNTGHISTVRLLPMEYKKMAGDIRGPRSAQYLVWRSSLLHTGSLFFAGIVILNAYTLVQSLMSEVSFMSVIEKRYHPYFDKLVQFSRLHSIGLLGSSVCAVLMAACATYTWRKLDRSGIFVLGSFLFSFVPPFFLLLVIPFRSGIDFEGIQQQICRDILAPSYDATPEQTLWPNFVSGDLTSLVTSKSNGVTFPADLCDQDPAIWGILVSDSIEDAGLLLDENGTCPAIDTSINTLSGLERTIGLNRIMANPMELNTKVGDGADCPDACSNCTTVCGRYLTQLGALTALHPAHELVTVVSTAGTDDAIGLGRCLHCFSLDLGLRCAWDCPSISEAVARQALAGKLAPSSSACVSIEDLRDFQLLTNLATKTVYWQMMLGAAYGAICFTALLPLALSLMFGAAKGSGIAKSVIPYSRLPGVVTCAAWVFTCPFLLQIAVLLQVSVGNLWTLLGIVCLLITMFTMMQPNLIAAQSHEDLKRRSERLQMFSRFLILVSVVLFFISFASRDITKQAFAMACEEGMCFSMDELWKAQGMLFWVVLRTIANFMGRSLLSTVFFADGVVALMFYFHSAEMSDPTEALCSRETLIKDLTTIFPLKVGGGGKPQKVKKVDSGGGRIYGKRMKQQRTPRE